MRTTDIFMEYTPDDVKTNSMYVPPKKPVEEMSLTELARGMCWKSQRKISACVACQARCSFGREIVRRCETNDHDGEQKAETEHQGAAVHA